MKIVIAVLLAILLFTFGFNTGDAGAKYKLKEDQVACVVVDSKTEQSRGAYVYRTFKYKCVFEATHSMSEDDYQKNLQLKSLTKGL